MHFVFNRPAQNLKVFNADGSLAAEVTASGDAWGDGSSGPHGHLYPIAPGHYKLTTVDDITPPIASEGAGQIWVADLTESDARGIHGATLSGNTLTLDGEVLPIGELGRLNRSQVMIHAGGSNAPDPFAPKQVLCKTEGCTRVYNEELPKLMHLVRLAHNNNELVVFTAIGEPKPVAD